MTGPGNLQDAGDRIEELLDQLGSLPDRRARQWAEELVRTVLDLYGAGLERIVELGCAEGAPGGPALLERLVSDEFVSSLLLIHDLHPLSLRARVERALDDIRAALGAGDVRLLELDEDRGTLRVRLLSPDSTVPQAIESRVRKLIEQAAPEIVHVEVDRPAHVSLGAALRNATPAVSPAAPCAAPVAAGTPVSLRRTVEAGT